MSPNKPEAERRVHHRGAVASAGGRPAAGVGRRGTGQVSGGRRSVAPSDAELVARFAAGDARAFSQFYARHAGVVYSLAFNMMRGRQAAEDLTQDVFLEVWKKAGDYERGRGSARAWVLSVVHNRGVDRLRGMGARRRAQERLARIVPASEPADAYSRTWEGLLRRRVNEALQLLPPEQLEVLELAYFAGRTHKEISRMLGVPLGTVKGRTRLALRRLRKHFEESGVGFP